jgi:riboflavin transporter FmnP
VLTALSVLLASLYPIPLFTDFLLYEPGDVPILLGGVTLGLGPGLLITVVTAVLMAAITSHGGIIGVIMHIVSTGTMVAAVTLVYRSKPSTGRYFAGAIAATIATTAVMVLWNLILTPLYLGAPREAVVKLLVPAIIPFNLIKAGVNTLLAYLVYRSVAPWLVANRK